jgi:hypothetical protein
VREKYGIGGRASVDANMAADPPTRDTVYTVENEQVDINYK